jgi:hypothetical protein
MPNRIIREGILTSPKVAKLGWPEEVFYRRVLSVVDDFGRYYADPGMLRAACYPRQLAKVSDSDVGKWLGACSDAALVRVYPAEDGERYLEVVKFDQQVRAKKSRFPAMRSGCVASATQAPANAHLDVDVDVSVDEGVDDAPAPKRSKSKSGTLLADWIAALPEGEAAIPADGAVFEYAAKIGLPPEYIALAWSWFKSEMAERKTRQANWRGHFFNAVKGNWPKFWFVDDAGGWGLTTKGKQAQRAAQ